MSLLDKFKNLTKANEREMFKTKKIDTGKINNPKYARITMDKQLQCTLCNILVKNEIMWLKHSKTDQHLKMINNFNLQSKKEIVVDNKNVSSQDKILEKLNCLNTNEEQKFIKNNNEDIINVNKKNILDSFLLESNINKDKSCLPKDFFDKDINIKSSKKEENQIKNIKNNIEIVKENSPKLIANEIIASYNFHEIITNKSQNSFTPTNDDGDEESLENYLKEVETMIECSEFVEHILSKKNKEKEIKKYQHLLQDQEIMSNDLIDNINKNFLKRKRLIDYKSLSINQNNEIINTTEVDSILDLDWRKQGIN